MASLIIPRPIAPGDGAGRLRRCERRPVLSMLNMLAEEPSTVTISINKPDESTVNDAARNILARSEFVAYLIEELSARQTHRYGHFFSLDLSEVEKVDFTTAPSLAVAPPRIAQALVSLESNLYEKLETTSRDIFIGQILWMHVRDDLIKAGDAKRAACEMRGHLNHIEQTLDLAATERQELSLGAIFAPSQRHAERQR